MANAAVLAVASLRTVTHPFEPLAGRTSELRHDVIVRDGRCAAPAVVLDAGLVSADRRPADAEALDPELGAADRRLAPAEAFEPELVAAEALDPELVAADRRPAVAVGPRGEVMDVQTSIDRPGGTR